MKKLITLLAIVLSIVSVSCEEDTCYDCYTIDHTVYYPVFNTWTERVCIEYDCND